MKIPSVGANDYSSLRTVFRKPSNLLILLYNRNVRIYWILVGDCKFLTDCVLEIVKLLVVGDIVDAVGGKIAADVGGSRAFAAASERVL